MRGVCVTNYPYHRQLSIKFSFSKLAVFILKEFAHGGIGKEFTLCPKKVALRLRPYLSQIIMHFVTFWLATFSYKCIHNFSNYLIYVTLPCKGTEIDGLTLLQMCCKHDVQEGRCNSD